MSGPFKRIEEESKGMFAMHKEGIPHGNIHAKIHEEAKKYKEVF
jgi:hypothetical protein